MSAARSPKFETRRLAREARCALDSEARAAAADALAERLLAIPEVANARVVLAYAANAEEIDLAPTVAALRGRGAAIAFPRVEAPGVLGVHLVVSDEELVPGALGIREPSPDAERIPRESIDAVLVPGVAFDAEGCRLGYGGGFYDRLLPTLRHDCRRVGVSFDEQIVDKLPVDDHDISVDVVATPTRLLVPSRHRAY